MNLELILHIVFSFAVFFGITYYLKQRSGKVDIQKVALESTLFTVLYLAVDMLVKKLGLF